ncbi:MAG: hypothetical protein QXM68_04345, partial [Candidatus Aenigmatarchaeota archaeon]
CFLIALIVLSGPSYGIDIFVNGLSLHNQNQKVPFSIVANIRQDELIPINYVNITLTFPNSTQTRCQIFPNSTVIGCDLIEFNQITFSGSYGYGYGYGYENTTRYELGYGYGYSNGMMELKLYLNTTLLPIGNHKIKAEIYAGTSNARLFSSPTSEFFISPFTTTTIITTPATTTTITTTPVTTTMTALPTTAIITTTAPGTTTVLTTITTTITTIHMTTTTIPVTTTVLTTIVPTTVITTTAHATTTTTLVTTTHTTTTILPTTTTISSICNGKAFANCLFYDQCQWVGDTRIGKCVEKQATTTTATTTSSSVTTPTLTTTASTTTTVASICDGRGFVNCLLMSQCKWVGDTRTGKCMLDPNYVTTTTVIETTVTTTTVLPIECYSKPLLSCILNSECKWIGDLRLGSCYPK